MEVVLWYGGSSHVALCMLGNFAAFLLSADSFSQWMGFFFENILSVILTEYLRV